MSIGVVFQNCYSISVLITLLLTLILSFIAIVNTLNSIDKHSMHFSTRSTNTYNTLLHLTIKLYSNTLLQLVKCLSNNAKALDN